jgi:hypothetical protein
VVIVVINIEGVLAEVGEDLMQCSPLQSGRMLFESFRDKRLDVVLMSTSRRHDKVETWLTREGFHGHIQLLTATDSVYNGDEFKQNVIEQLLGAQHFIAFVIDSDPNILTTYVSEIGVPALLFVPSYERPGKVTVPYRPWDSLVESLEVESLERARLAESRQGTDG